MSFITTSSPDMRALLGLAESVSAGGTGGQPAKRSPRTLGLLSDLEGLGNRTHIGDLR